MPISDPETHAKELHRKAIVIDGHSDILIPIVEGKTRLGIQETVPDPAVWTPSLGVSLAGISESGAWEPQDNLSIHSLHFGPIGQYSLPQFKTGGLTVQGCAIYLDDGYLPHALEHGLKMALSLLREVEENEDLVLITQARQIRQAKQQGKCGVIMTFEGLEPLADDLQFLEVYYKLGLRVAGLTHMRRNLFADGAFEGIKTGGLTVYGQRAVRRMNELGIVIDLAHISEEGFWEILHLTEDPVVLSHSTSTMFPAGPPNSKAPIVGIERPGLVLSRDRGRLEAIAQNGGVIGIIFFTQRDISDVVADIELAMEVMGADHVGLGSDYYGLGLAPYGLQDISRLPELTLALVKRGHSDDVILKILGANYLRVFEAVWN